MPQNSFRLPSASELDRHQSNPAASNITPKVAFKWKKDGKLSKDISCYLSGETVPGKKSKEPDIPVAMYKDGKMLTIYQPNMGRVDVEDTKGLEVVFLLSAAVIKDIFFNPNREMFNINAPNTAGPPRRKNSGPVIATRKPSLPVMSGAVTSPISSTGRAPASRIPSSSQAPPQNMYAHSQQPPTTNTQQIDAETARLRALVEREAKERERADREEQKRIKKMLEAEEKERRRREAEVAKETERLRKQYGVTGHEPPQINVKPPMPPRPQQQQQPIYQPQPYPQFHNVQRPSPVPRPLSTPSGPPPGSSSPPSASLSTWLQRPVKGSSGSSGFLGLGGKKLEKKRSVFF